MFTENVCCQCLLVKLLVALSVGLLEASYFLLFEKMWVRRRLLLQWLTISRLKAGFNRLTISLAQKILKMKTSRVPEKVIIIIYNVQSLWRSPFFTLSCKIDPRPRPDPNPDLSQVH